jgi:hypothetical protein
MKNVKGARNLQNFTVAPFTVNENSKKYVYLLA